VTLLHSPLQILGLSQKRNMYETVSVWRSQAALAQSWKFSLVALLASALAFSSATARGAAISYQATDLTDTTVGQDLWRYSFTIDGYVFQTGQGFSVFFDSPFYRNLQNPQPSSSSEWSMLAVQPDLILQQPGFFDGQALVNSPSLANPFQVDFVWLGLGTPASQSFSIYDVNFSTLSSGSTVVPEPQALTFLSLGVLCLWAPMNRVSRMLQTSKHESQK
jgi:hypothetical protein